jgi:hypothetical protein
LADALLLLLDQELGITDDVDEQHMPNFESKIVVGFQRHHVSLARGSSGDDYYFVSFGAREATIFLKR